MHPEIKAVNELRRNQQYDFAMPRITKYVTDHPQDPAGYNLYGALLRETNQIADSLKAYEKAAKAYHYRKYYAMSLLHDEQWAVGWNVYESRYGGDIRRQVVDDVPIWDGKAPYGRRILVFQEQGQGDGIQFARYIRVLSAAGAIVTYWCSPKLRPLMEASKATLGIDQVWAVNTIKGTFDAQVPVMSLPYRLKCYERTPKGLPFPYLATMAEVPGGPLPESPGKRRIAIAWSCKRKADDFRTRSCALEAFAPLSECEDLALWSVQVPYRDKSDADWLAKRGVLDLSGRLDTFDDTAAVLRQVHAVVTVDTSVAHLAGALNVPTIVMLRYGADWRWHRHNAALSPWYPNMHLVRQTTPNDWDDVIQRVVAKLYAPPFVA